MGSKIISQQFGPVHFETRFIPFLENNRDVHHNFTYVVNIPELYTSQRSDCRILDVADFQKDHWGKSLEVVYAETNVEKYIDNFVEQKIKLPLNLVRFGLLDCYNQDILNVIYAAPNIFFTNKNDVINDYLNSIPPGTFHAPLFHSESSEFSDYSHIKPLLETKYKEFKVTNQFYYFDGFHFGMHFRNKDDMLFFYEMWDYMVKLYYTEPTLAPFLNVHYGYTKYEQFVGYIMKFFEINFGYKVENYLKYFSNSTIGQHNSLPHDTWYYTGVRNWNEQYGISLNDSIKTISDFIKHNKKGLIKYYSNVHAQNLAFEITDNNVVLTHRNL